MRYDAKYLKETEASGEDSFEAFNCAPSEVTSKTENSQSIHRKVFRRKVMDFGRKCIFLRCYPEKLWKNIGGRLET